MRNPLSKFKKVTKSLIDGKYWWKCPERSCHKKYTTKQNLMNHGNWHCGRKPYKCSHCPSRFTTRSGLSQHQRVHTGEKPYSCARCGKGFCSKQSKNRHEESRHGIQH